MGNCDFVLADIVMSSCRYIFFLFGHTHHCFVSNCWSIWGIFSCQMVKNIYLLANQLNNSHCVVNTRNNILIANSCTIDIVLTSTDLHEKYFINI